MGFLKKSDLLERGQNSDKLANIRGWAPAREPLQRLSAKCYKCFQEGQQVEEGEFSGFQPGVGRLFCDGSQTIPVECLLLLGAVAQVDWFGNVVAQIKGPVPSGATQSAQFSEHLACLLAAQMIVPEVGVA